jgi:hypothetical protein
MLSARLVRTIEDHAEELTRGVLNDLATNQKTPNYHRLSREELHRRVYDVYRNLGRWLSDTSDAPIEASYSELGHRRGREGVPLSEVVYALVLTKHHLREYIRSSGLVESVVELYQEEELNELVGRFFDKAVYYTVAGYEMENSQRPAAVYSSRGPS